MRFPQTRRVLLLLLIAMWLPLSAAAQETLPSDSGPATDTSPTISTNGEWAGVMLIVIAGLFLAAAVIGPIVRAEGEGLPPTFSHHEDPTHHTGLEPDAAEEAVE